MGVGLFVRIITANNQNSEGLYIIQQLMIVLSPASFLAYNYILFGKFTARCVGPHHAAISARKFGRVFVTSDIITFLIQVIVYYGDDRPPSLTGHSIGWRRCTADLA